MNVRVRYGAGLSELSASVGTLITLNESAALEDLIAKIEQRDAKRGAALSASLAVVDGECVPRSRLLMEGEEVTFVLPTAGG